MIFDKRRIIKNIRLVRSGVYNAHIRLTMHKRGKSEPRVFEFGKTLKYWTDE
jgi:hypothetical protein